MTADVTLYAQWTAATVAVTGVTLDKTTLTLTAGATGTLIATATPSDATNKTVTWTSSNEAVATVSNGQVTAVVAGTATITVTTTDGGKTADCAVTVNAAGSGEEPGTDPGTDPEPGEDIEAGVQFSGDITAANMFAGFVGFYGAKAEVGADYGTRVWTEWQRQWRGWWPIVHVDSYFNPYTKGVTYDQTASYAGLKVDTALTRRPSPTPGRGLILRRRSRRKRVSKSNSWGSLCSREPGGRGTSGLTRRT